MTAWLDIENDLLVKGQSWVNWPEGDKVQMQVCLDQTAVMLLKVTAISWFTNQLSPGQSMIVPILWSDVSWFTLKGDSSDR